jgi:hypothetical protein
MKKKKKKQQQNTSKVRHLAEEHKGANQRAFSRGVCNRRHFLPSPSFLYASQHNVVSALYPVSAC